MFRRFGIAFISLVVFVAFAAGVVQAAPIHDASAKGDIAKVRSLLKKTPALVKAKDKDGATPLHYACAAGKKDVVKLLLDKKADVNAAKKDGVTPLHAASALGKKDVVELLLDNKAEINARDKQGRTPLALAKANNRTDVVQLLLARGAIDSAETPASTDTSTYQPDKPEKPAETSAPQPVVDFKTEAQKVMGLVQAGDYDGVVARFDDTMRAAFPAAKIRELWQGAINQYGAFEGVSGVQMQKVQGYDVALVGCKFAKGQFVLQLTLNAEGKVSGLFIR